MGSVVTQGLLCTGWMVLGLTVKNTRQGLRGCPDLRSLDGTLVGPTEGQGSQFRMTLKLSTKM